MTAIDLRHYRIVGKLNGSRPLNTFDPLDQCIFQFEGARWSRDSIQRDAMLPLWALERGQTDPAWQDRLVERVIREILPLALDAVHLLATIPTDRIALLGASLTCRQDGNHLAAQYGRVAANGVDTHESYAAGTSAGPIGRAVLAARHASRACGALAAEWPAHPSINMPFETIYRNITLPMSAITESSLTVSYGNGVEKTDELLRRAIWMLVECYEADRLTPRACVGGKR